MATAPERSRPLHNFTLPRLKWGNQRFLRCMKVNNANGDNHRLSAMKAESDDSNHSRAATEVIERRSSKGFKRLSSSPLKPIAGSGESNGIEAVREKLMFDLRIAADKMKVSIIEEKKFEESNSAVPPWNLRTRRAACKAPNESVAGCGGEKGANLRSEEGQHRNNCNSSHMRPEILMETVKSSRCRGLVAAVLLTAHQSAEKRDMAPKAEFSISLSREEVEIDYLAITGIRPPRRPRKRPKIIQKQVDAFFPGLWLTEITLDTYRVPEFPESGKA